MAATITRLRTRADRLKTQQADELRQLILAFPGLPERATNEILREVDRQTAADHGWTFVMIDVERQAEVVTWLAEHAHRPKAAVVLWAQLFTVANHQTGEILADRRELAQRAGITENDVSRIMGQLVAIGALIRSRSGNRYRYAFNPLIATSLAGAARDKAQREAPALTLASDARKADPPPDAA